MTDTPALRSLLDGDYTAVGVAALLDEVISAELDDALDDVADDWGVGPFALRSAVRGAPDYDDRRESLARARSTLAASPVSRLDDVTRRRLVSTALDATGSGSTDATAGRSRSASRVVRLSAAAAVVLLLGVAGAVVLAQQSNDSDGDAVATGAADMSGEAELTEPLGDLPDLGDLDDVAAVVSDGIGVTLTPVQGDAAEPLTIEAPQGAPAGSGEESDTAADGASRSMTMTPRECASQVEHALPTGGEIVLRATGTIGGVPVAVVATRNGDLLTVATAPLDRCDIPTLESFAVAD